MKIPAMLVLTLVLLVGAALPSISVFAHARLESSAPSRGEILALPPTEVEIVFTQEIQKIAGSYDITVNKDRGSSVTSGPAVIDEDDRTRLSVPLATGLADGRYVVRWKNISDEDGDPAEGAFSFYINYQPNTIDLANDADLEQIGAEPDETPAAETPTTEETPSDTPGAAVTPAATANPAASPTPATVDESDDGDRNTGLIIVVVVAAVIAAGAAAIGVMRLRR